MPTTGRSALRAPAERGRCGAERDQCGPSLKGASAGLRGGRCGRLTAGRSGWREPWGPAHCAPGPTASPQAHRPEFFTDWLSLPPCMSVIMQTISWSFCDHDFVVGTNQVTSSELSS